ncbi:MAG: hypothetical protein ACYDBX_02335 [Patescibacteria group bacterium]
MKIKYSLIVPEEPDDDLDDFEEDDEEDEFDWDEDEELDGVS